MTTKGETENVAFSPATTTVAVSNYGAVSVEDSGAEESLLFREKEEVLSRIDGLSREGRDKALESIRAIFDKYLECPTLLDPCLQIMVEKLVSQVKQELQQDDASVSDNSAIIRYPLTALYALCKVRGYKCVTRFLSHNVHDVDLIWKALALWRSNLKLARMWEPLYLLWHWMGMLSLVPFHSQVVSGNVDLLPDLIAAARTDLAKHTGPVQEAACTCLASWLSRPDAEEDNQPQQQKYLMEFASWAADSVLSQEANGTSSNINSKSINETLGTLQVVTKILKHGSRSRHVLMERLVQPLWGPLLQLADSSGSSNLLLRRYLVKWWTRTSCAHFPPSAHAFAPWRYQRGQRMLLSQNASQGRSQIDKSATADVFAAEDESAFPVPDEVEDAMGRLLEALGHSSTVVRWSAAKGVGRVTERLPAACALDVLDAVLEYFEQGATSANEHGWHGACLALAELARKGLLLPSSLPQVVHYILQALHFDVQRRGAGSASSGVGANVRDAACYTFWAFARSYSPTILEAHLKNQLAEAVILTALLDREVNCRRAASAAFQEAVGRQGTFPHGIYIVTTADFYSLGNRTDAFTTLAAKIALLPEYRRAILEHLYQNKLFHWDPAIRQLASKGLATVAPLDTDRKIMGQEAMEFLLEKSLDSKNLEVRHGAVLGVAEWVRVAGGAEALQSCLSQKTFDKLLDLVNQIEKRRLYRGKGGEIMRVATCRLVECIALAKLPLSVKTHQVRMLDAVDASIAHPNEGISQCACTSLHQLLTVYFPVGEKGPTDRLRLRVMEKFTKTLETSKNPAATRGYALALGHLPSKLVAPNTATLERVIAALLKAAHPVTAKVDGEGDAETRRNAIQSLALVAQTVMGATADCETQPTFPVQMFSKGQCARVVAALFLSLEEDYNLDRRGDVGSWCRMAAMDGLVSLMVLVCSPKHSSQANLFEGLSSTRLVGALIKQLAERLHSVRVRAGSCLQRVLQLSPNESQAKALSVVGKEKLIAALQLQESVDHNWADAKSVFGRVMKTALICSGEENGDYPYYEPAIAGFIASVGGKAESVHATREFIDHTEEMLKDSSPQHLRLGNTLLKIFERHARVARVTLALLRSIEKLLSKARDCQQLLWMPVKEGEKSQTFAGALLSHMDFELEGCRRDMNRLLALADVAGAVLNASQPSDSSNELHQDLHVTYLQFLCRFLYHSYPRVRSHAAEILYMAVQDLSTISSNRSDACSTLVAETPWGSDMAAEEVQRAASDVERCFVAKEADRQRHDET